jgi:hypothetical protein
VTARIDDVKEAGSMETVTLREREFDGSHEEDELP